MKCLLRLYEELNDYLPEEKRKTDFEVSFQGKTTVRQVLGRLRVPSDEIDLILVNGRPVDLDYVLVEGDRASIYPVFESINIRDATRMRRPPLRRPKFIADAGLRALAEYLKNLGHDVLVDSSLTSKELIAFSSREKRIILTEKEEMIGSEGVSHIVLLRPGTPREQAESILRRLDLED